MGRRLRRRRKYQDESLGISNSFDPVSPLEPMTVESPGSSCEIPRPLPDTSNHVMPANRLPHLQPITSFSSLSGLSNVFLPPGMSAVGPNRANVINNSSVIEIIVHLLCKEREPDTARRKLLFQALCKAIKQWNNPLYIPLHSFTELRDFRNTALEKFEFLFEELQTQIRSQTENLIIPSLHHLPPSSGSPLTQLALTDSHEYHFLDDRYSREFIELELLGKGGFGSVVKAESKLDGRTYAVKIIIMDEKDHETNEKLLREVKALAHLDHPNIVRYHTSWLQLYAVPPHIWPENHNRRPFRDKVKVNVYPPSQVKIHELSSDAGSELFEESSGGIVFAEESRSKTTNRTSCITKKISTCQTINETAESDVENEIILEGKFKQSLDKSFLKVDRKSTSISSTSSRFYNQHSKFFSMGDSNFSALTQQSEWSLLEEENSICEENLYNSTSSDSDPVPKNSVMLYREQERKARMALFIQMGLCGQTLGDWIRIRNIEHLGPNFDAVDFYTCLEFLKQILFAVQYIHSQRIVHRDLKPPNIFFTEDKTLVKLGDFGLARPMFDPADLSETKGINLSLAPVSLQTGNTGGVGTPIYSPPELKFGGIYGSKSDMYNLGIILLELFHPFQTGSERIDMIHRLKTQRYLDPELVHRWPEIASWILKLTDHDQSRRPTAKDLLTSISRLEKLDTISVQKNTFNSNQITETSIFGSTDLEKCDRKDASQSEMDKKTIESQTIKDLLRDNRIKDDRIRTLEEENFKLHQIIAQLKEQNNQSK